MSRWSRPGRSLGEGELIGGGCLWSWPQCWQKFPPVRSWPHFWHVSLRCCGVTVGFLLLFVFGCCGGVSICFFCFVQVGFCFLVAVAVGLFCCALFRLSFSSLIVSFLFCRFGVGGFHQLPSSAFAVASS